MECKRRERRRRSDRKGKDRLSDKTVEWKGRIIIVEKNREKR